MLLKTNTYTEFRLLNITNVYYYSQLIINSNHFYN